jgi:hypothetical protein
MRPLAIAALLLLPCLGLAQVDTVAAQPLVLRDAIGLQLSRMQVYNAAVRAWTYTFGQEPGAKVELEDAANGLLEGTARFNYRSSMLADREETMGVITYHVTIQAENGQCRIHISQVQHTGNRNAMGGGIDIGPIYAGARPKTRIRGISLGTAQEVHADMRMQVSAELRKVMNAFAARMRAAASTTK